jgi:hypothetical protein
MAPGVAEDTSADCGEAGGKRGSEGQRDKGEGVDVDVERERSRRGPHVVSSLLLGR